MGGCGACVCVGQVCVAPRRAVHTRFGLNHSRPPDVSSPGSKPRRAVTCWSVCGGGNPPQHRPLTQPAAPRAAWLCGPQTRPRRPPARPHGLPLRWLPRQQTWPTATYGQPDLVRGASPVPFSCLTPSGTPGGNTARPRCREFSGLLHTGGGLFAFSRASRGRHPGCRVGSGATRRVPGAAAGRSGGTGRAAAGYTPIPHPGVYPYPRMPTGT